MVRKTKKQQVMSNEKTHSDFFGEKWEVKSLSSFTPPLV